MSDALADGADDVAIEVGATQFKGWQTVSIARSCESLPNSFSLTASTEFMQSAAALAGTRPGQACKIKIGTDQVISGWIDRRSISVDARSHQVTITGRGLTRNLVDCSADLREPDLLGGSVRAPNLLNLAQRLARHYGVSVYSAVPDLGREIPLITAHLGETPYELIESAAGYAGYLLYEDANGAMVLDRIGSQAMASGFTMPGNIEAIAAERSVDQRYSEYLVTFSSVDQLVQYKSNANDRASNTKDDQLGETRLKIIVSAQSSPDRDFAQQTADWEFARRYGRGQAAQITCDRWRDKNKVLWTPNRLATIEAPAADISGANWIIGSVTLRKDMSGTHADLVLMPPEAFSINPSPLNLFAAQYVNAPKVSQNPAPPSTAAPTPVAG